MSHCLLTDICHSLPTASVTPKIPVKARANTMPSDLVTPPSDPHSNPVEETGNVNGYPPQEGMGQVGQSYTQPVALVHQVDLATSHPPAAGPAHPHTVPITQPIAMQPLSGVYYSTKQQQQPQAGPVPAPHTPNSQPVMYRTYTPVLIPVASHDAHSAMTPQSMSASSSVIELQMYTPPSTENILTCDLTSSQTPPMPSQEEAATNCDLEAAKSKHQVHKGLPRANSYPRGMVHSILLGNQSPSHGQNNATTPPSRLMYVMSTGNRQQLRGQRAMTPPATLGKRVSAPVFNYRPGSAIPAYDRHSLPPGLSLRSLSVASQYSEVSQPSSATLQQPSELVMPTQPAGGNDTASTTNGLIYIPSNNTTEESGGKIFH